MTARSTVPHDPSGTGRTAGSMSDRELFSVLPWARSPIGRGQAGDPATPQALEIISGRLVPAW